MYFNLLPENDYTYFAILIFFLYDMQAIVFGKWGDLSNFDEYTTDIKQRSVHEVL